MDRDIYPPGTQLTVGSHLISIIKYFSKGGFAQVYTCSITPKWNNKSIVCLKRVKVPDKPSLNILRKEVDAMRKLQGHDCIVSYIDSHATRSNNGIGPGYEVFMLMEYCSNKGLIDFMNTRLVNKLNENEILNIMEQITHAVAFMHSLNPPLIHRDIKIENVLIDENFKFKLCDFGSVSTIINPPKNIEEFKSIQDDIMQNTTPQYRCPEMLDLYSGKKIDEKSDIWALGVFLYKLCFYTTPFESNSINGNFNGDYAIMKGIYKIPNIPIYSERLKNVIMKLLMVDPNLRPNVFQLLDEIRKMRGKNPIHMEVKVPPKTNYLTVPMQQQQINNSVTGFNNMVSSSSSSKSSQLHPSGNSNTSLFKYNELKKSITNTIEDKIPNDQNTIHSLSPTKLRNKNRPLSVYEKKTDDINNITSSMDFIKAISRENTSSGNSRQTSRSKKRSSITSLKNLLTGGSMKGSSSSNYNYNNNNGSSSSSSSSGSNESYSKRSISNELLNNTLGDLQEMSPETKKPQSFEINKLPKPISIEIIPTIKRTNSIQNRVKTLFRNTSPPTIKTAQGYGKYTDEQLKKSISIKKPLPPPKPKKPDHLKTLDNNELRKFELKYPGTV